MAERTIRRALIAVYDKTGIVEFARALVDEFGVEIISTGGTAKHLCEAGIPVTPVEKVTGFPEMLDGRVKTLHPRIHAAILADRDNPEHMRQLAEQGIEPIDMVVVNLYPFEKTAADPKCRFENAIEMIDIGGPCLLRAAGKNHRQVLVVTGDVPYERLLLVLRRVPDGAGRDALYRGGGWSAFNSTSKYDEAVAKWLGAGGDGGPAFVHECRVGSPPMRLRYGENPHQEAELILKGSLFTQRDEQRPGALLESEASGCTQPSFNNYVDADAALGLCAELSRAVHSSACCFIKHTNPCGVGVADDPIEAYRRAYLGDPNAAMGGILACNFRVEKNVAAAVMETYDRFGKSAGAGGFFVEVWVAPDFDVDAVKAIRSLKKWGENVRLLVVGDMHGPVDPRERVYRSIVEGLLVQSADQVGLNEGEWKLVTKRSPKEREMADLRQAWLVAKHTKSNAISICRDGMLIGNGAGQMSRVMSCRVATWLAKENGHADKLTGAAAASDAFFPFADGPGLLLEAGVTAIIQPGGSKRDAETIAACDQRGAAMVFTGTRHFRH